MESALTPREIQARIRGGESLEEVAQAAGVYVEQIDAYAGPVLAEREHAATLARNFAGAQAPRIGCSAVARRSRGRRISRRGCRPGGDPLGFWRDENAAGRSR